MTVVFDTNTLISASILPNSVPGKAFNSSVKTIETIYSTATLEELEM